MARRGSEVSQFRARVTGRVQGVGFRYFAQREAQRLGLKGWVRNLSGGDVEVVAQGPEDALQEMLRTLRQGPPLAWVRDVVVEWQPPDKSLVSFHIKPTSW
jgi:acylphosphatase